MLTHTRTVDGAGAGLRGIYTCMTRRKAGGDKERIIIVRDKDTHITHGLGVADTWWYRPHACAIYTQVYCCRRSFRRRVFMAESRAKSQWFVS